MATVQIFSSFKEKFDISQNMYDNFFCNALLYRSLRQIYFGDRSKLAMMFFYLIVFFLFNLFNPLWSFYHTCGIIKGHFNKKPILIYYWTCCYTTVVQLSPLRLSLCVYRRTGTHTGSLAQIFTIQTKYWYNL